MALVAQGRQGVAAAIGAALARYAGRIGRERLEQLQDQLVDDVIMGGAEALGGIRTTMQNFLRTNAQQLGDQGWHLTAMMQDAVQRTWNENREVWDNLMNQGRENLNAVGEWEAGNTLRNQQEAGTREVALDSQGETTLDELIPENNMESTSGNQGTKRPATEPPAGEPEAARVASGGGPGGPVSKETPISPYPTLTFGLQETHTTILPWTGYMSAVGMDLGTPIVLELRTTQPFDMIKSEITATPVAGASVAWAKGLYTRKFNDSNLVTDAASAIQTATFPSTMGAGAYTAERPTWWTYWSKLYEYYTVLGCEYEIIIDNPSTVPTGDILIGWDYNAYTTAAGASGNITPQTANLHQMKQFKGINWMNVGNMDLTAQKANGNRKVLKGVYKPGMARRNITNDGEVKTWHKTATPEPTSLQELLTLYLYSSEFYTKVASLGASQTLGINMQISMKYIVQFKDLYQQARYPLAGIADITLIIDDHVSQVPA